MQCLRAHDAHLQSEEVGKVAAALLAAQEDWREGSTQQQALQVPNGLVLKVQQRQSIPHHIAPLHICRPICTSRSCITCMHLHAEYIPRQQLERAHLPLYKVIVRNMFVDTQMQPLCHFWAVYHSVKRRSGAHLWTELGQASKGVSARPGPPCQALQPATMLCTGWPPRPAALASLLPPDVADFIISALVQRYSVHAVPCMSVQTTGNLARQNFRRNSCIC